MLVGMNKRGAMIVAVLCGGACAPGVASAAELCGRAGDVPTLLLSLQKPTTESLWRDKTMFVLRDGDDGTLWAFSIKNSTVHPAVRCRRSLDGGQRVDSGQICNAAEVGDKACASFAAQADQRFATIAASAPAVPPR